MRLRAPGRGCGGTRTRVSRAAGGPPGGSPRCRGRAAAATGPARGPTGPHCHGPAPAAGVLGGRLERGAPAHTAARAETEIAEGFVHASPNRFGLPVVTGL